MFVASRRLSSRPGRWVRGCRRTAIRSIGAVGSVSRNHPGRNRTRSRFSHCSTASCTPSARWSITKWSIVIKRAFTLWFTGLSGSGKSTLAREVGTELMNRGYRVEILDGDEVRQTVTQRVGFSKAGRDLNVRYMGSLASLFSRHGVVAIVAAISPYAATRQAVRRRHGGEFVEVYLECGLAAMPFGNSVL